MKDDNWTRVADAAIDGMEIAVKAVEDLRKQKDFAYRERNQMIALAAKLAYMNGYSVYFAVDKKSEPGFQNVLFIELPTGQVSWHLADADVESLSWIHEYPNSWDGHTTEEKWARVAKFSGTEPL